MANLFEVHHQSGETELKKYVIALDETDARGYLAAQESAGSIEPGWTIFDMGAVENTESVTGPTQLTKAVDGRWDETA